MGADGVEIDVLNELRIADFSQTALRQFRKMLKDYRLSVAAVSFPTRHGLHETEGLEQRILAIGEAMQFAYKIGARVLLHRAEQLPPLPQADSQTNETPTESPSLVTWLDSMQLLGHRGDHVGTQLAVMSGEAPEHQAALIERVPETIGFGFHPVMLLREGHSPGEAAEVLASRTVHLHAVDGVRDFGSTQNVSEVELGRGSADMPTILSRLEERGYQGWITVERQRSQNVRQEMDNAIAYLRSL